MQTDPRAIRSAADWFGLVLDTGYAEVEDRLATADPLRFPGYAPDGAESVRVASGSVHGHPAEVVAFDFAVLGGSMGVVAGERIARAFERAVERRAGVVALLASGGARMQEGMVSLVQMAKTVVARQSLAKAGLPFIAYLRHPTTGGAYASFTGLADFLWAQPEATIGFAGPRVAAEMSGRPLPAGSHTAEFSLAKGLVDAIVAPGDLRASVAGVMDHTLGSDLPVSLDHPAESVATSRGLDAWEEYQVARHPQRPTARRFAESVVENLVTIRGDRAGTSDTGILAGLGRVAGRRVGVIAHERTPLGPSAYRTSQRLVRMAGRFGLPVVTFVDTPGASPTAESEAGGIVRAISGTFRDLLEHPYPVVCVVTGEGGSGGALAFACADRLLILEHAVFSVIGPEGAAAILRRDDVGAVARDLRPTSASLASLGIADEVIPEPGEGAHSDDAGTAARIRSAVARALGEIGPAPAADRALRWREAGNRYLSRP